jgi:four helix bundle protein
LEPKNKPPDIKERTFDFAVKIVRFCDELFEVSTASRRLSYQLLDSGTSIGANVEEAQAGQSRGDFISKYAISLKETRETIYWLRLLVASGQFTGERIQNLRREAEEIARIIGAIIVRAKKNDRRK